MRIQNQKKIQKAAPWIRRPYSMLVVIVLAGGLAYANSFSTPFQFDDDAYIVNNPVIRTFHFFTAPAEVAELAERSPTALPPAIRSAFMTRMLCYVSFALNFRMHGLDVTGYHIVNLAIHISNAFFVYLILLSVMKSARFAAPGRLPVHDSFLAGMAALLFAVHPIQTQAVTYISQRFASLAAFFYLLAFLLYVRFSLAAPGRRRKAVYGLAVVSAVAAMLTKEFTVTLPVMLALYDIVFTEGSNGDRIRRLAPFAATLMIIPALVLMQNGSLRELDSTMRTITAADASKIGRTEYLLTQFRVIALYLRLLFVPIGQNIDHHIRVYTSLFQPPVLLSCLLLLSLSAGAVGLYVVSNRRRNYPELRLSSFGIIWFFITLSVESSFIPMGELAAEYRLYLPSIGMITAVCSLALFGAKRLPESAKARPILMYGVATLAVVPLLVATFLRNTVWNSEIALWEDAARKSPALIRPHQNLAIYFGRQGRLEDAERELIAALKLEPSNFELHNNLGVLYKQLGAYDHAVREYETVLKLSPDDAMAHYNLSNVYLAEGRMPEAVREYETTVRLIPDYDEAHNNLGIAYHKTGRFNAAITEFRRALELNPGNMNAAKNLKESLKQAAQQNRRQPGSRSGVHID